MMQNDNLTTPAIHALIWILILSIPLIVPNPYNNAFPVTFDFIIGFLHLGLFYINAYFLYPRLVNRRWWWFYPVCIVLIVLITFQLKLLILKFGFPITAYSEDKNGLLGFPVILFLVASIIYRVVLDRITQEKMVQVRESEQLTSELKFLRSQISPHFLFNVLNNMVSMARHKSDNLERSLIRLAELMRYMLYDSQARKVALSKEIEYLRSYIQLQKIRFEDDVEITFVLKNNTDSYSLEPMLLIPFVENAFKHGIALVDNPFIHIELEVKDHTLDFSVANKFRNGDSQSRDKDSGIGLTNVKSRLQLLYPENHILTVENHLEIFKIHLKLPLI